MSLTDLALLLIAVTAGASVAAFYAYDSRTVLGTLVRALLAAQAFSPESAKTFSELSLPQSARFSHALRPGTSLSAVVCCTEEAKKPRRVLGVRESAYDLSAARFYLNEQKRAEAESHYAKHVGTLLTPILTTLGAATLCALVYFLLPMLVEFTA